MENTTKTCTKCGEGKPATTEFFHIEKRARDGFRSICRSCRNAEAVAASNRPGEKERLRAYRESRGTAESQIEKAPEGCFKRCNKCKTVKPATLDNFGPHRLGKYGVASRCRPCTNEDAEIKRNGQKFKEWYSKNHARIMAQQKQYVLDNKEKVSVRRKAYYNSIPREVANAKSKEKRDRNPEYYREYHRKQEIERRKNPAYKLKMRVSTRINMMVKNGKNGKTTQELLGYTAQELKEHIEKQFKPGMSWENIGEWHIDHKRPVSSFNINSIDDPDFLICWGLSNLQPLWAFDNVSKGAKWDGR